MDAYLHRVQQLARLKPAEKVPAQRSGGGEGGLQVASEVPRATRKSILRQELQDFVQQEVDGPPQCEHWADEMVRTHAEVTWVDHV